MGEIGATIQADAVLGLGDNFYDSGVKNEYDPRFKETFEDVFTAPSIANIPYWMVAGNHDHRGNVSGEIQYSNHSQRWNFPDFYYSTTFKTPGGKTLQLVMVDTVQLCGLSDDKEYCDNHGIPMEQCLIHPTGPCIFTHFPQLKVFECEHGYFAFYTGPADMKLALGQWAWINMTLQASTADFLIVAGHYPVWSIAEHGPTACLVEELIPMLEANKVTAYFSGHDHTFEYIDDGKGVGYVDTGGTHTCDSSQEHKPFIPKDSLKFHGCGKGGFTQIHIDDNAGNMTVSYYFGNSTKVQYTTTFKPRM